MKIGFGRNDITPRVGVELCGFGPYNLRRSIAVRDRLWARAAAFERDGRRMVIISCDLILTDYPTSQKVRQYVAAATGLSLEAIMVHSTHTHSGPCTGALIGWGAPDAPYIETLPQRIAQAAIQAVTQLQPATLSHAITPCEGIAVNREVDGFIMPFNEAVGENWRPAHPELTDTVCHVFRAESAGKITGFLSYFSCHPVVCCEATHYIHGDFVGVATNLIEREHPGSIGLFLQGAQGDINPCVAHQSEEDSLLALDVIASRYARSVRQGLASAQPIEVDALTWATHHVDFTRRPWGPEKIRAMLAEKEALAGGMEMTDQTESPGLSLRMQTVHLQALRGIVASLNAGRPITTPLELQGMRLGPVALLGSPLETFQAIKNDVVAKARSPIPLVMGFANHFLGYAVDRATAARGGYATDVVPMMCGTLPFANIHDELAQSLLDLEAKLF